MGTGPLTAADCHLHSVSLARQWVFVLSHKHHVELNWQKKHIQRIRTNAISQAHSKFTRNKKSLLVAFSGPSHRLFGGKCHTHALGSWCHPPRKDYSKTVLFVCCLVGFCVGVINGIYSKPHTKANCQLRQYINQSQLMYLIYLNQSKSSCRRNMTGTPSQQNRDTVTTWPGPSHHDRDTIIGTPSQHDRYTVATWPESRRNIFFNYLNLFWSFSKNKKYKTHIKH